MSGLSMKARRQGAVELSDLASRLLKAGSLLLRSAANLADEDRDASHTLGPLRKHVTSNTPRPPWADALLAIVERIETDDPVAPRRHATRERNRRQSEHMEHCRHSAEAGQLVQYPDFARRRYLRDHGLDGGDHPAA